MLVDSHCHLDHLDLTAYDGNLDAVMEEARQHHVQHMLCVAISIKNFQEVLRIAKHYPNVSASVGMHPNETDATSVDELVKLGQDEKVVAVGETGLDYYRTEADGVAVQQQNFRAHIQAAIALGKPLIIHTRQAQKDTIKIMREENAEKIGGVMHCFTEDTAMAEEAMAMGFYISFSGIITFKNAVALQEVVRNVPLEKMLVETDAPYLAPIPFRGKPNVPAYVAYVADAVAKLKGIAVDEVARQTTENFSRLFGVHPSL